jgi:hypothetical protein
MNLHLIASCWMGSVGWGWLWKGVVWLLYGDGSAMVVRVKSMRMLWCVCAWRKADGCTKISKSPRIHLQDMELAACRTSFSHFNSYVDTY